MVVGVGAVGLAVGLVGTGSSSCAAAVVGTAQVPPVFAPPSAPVVRTDPNLERLISAVRRSGIGHVIGAVGYDQTPWLHSASVPGGFATWTADNAVIGFRDPQGRVRWGLRQTMDPQAWAVVGGTFVNLDLRPGKPVQVGGYAAMTGVPRWCAMVGRPTKYGDPLTVAPGRSGSVWVVTVGPTLSHLSADGTVLAQTDLTGVDRADSVTQVGSLLMVGGRANHLLTAPDPQMAAPRSDAAVLTAFDGTSMKVRWQWGRGLTAHVLGAANGQVLVEVARDGRLGLVALDRDGQQRWAVALPEGTTADMALRASMRIVIIRSAHTISGYDARNGARRWTRTLAPASDFPYGFDLETQASVAGHLLLATTSALVSIDPTTGLLASYALPTDGSATTFWPYEVTISGGSAIVETNTGAVLVALRSRV